MFVIFSSSITFPVFYVIVAEELEKENQWKDAGISSYVGGARQEHRIPCSLRPRAVPDDLILLQLGSTGF